MEKLNSRDKRIVDLKEELKKLLRERQGTMVEEFGLKSQNIAWCANCGDNKVNAGSGIDTCSSCLEIY